MIPNPFRVLPFRDPDAPTERECVGRVAFFTQMAEHWRYQQAVAIVEGDEARKQAALAEEQTVVRMLARWQRFLAEARENAGVPA